jgi:hypothetical protein
MPALNEHQLTTLKRLLCASYEHVLEVESMHYVVADDAAATRCKTIADQILFEFEYLDHLLAHLTQEFHATESPIAVAMPPFHGV